MDKQLLNKVTQQLKLAPNGSSTQTGQNNKATDDQLTAINQIFELFRFNYHNQFLKAFPDLDSLNMAKRLWLRLLGEYSGAVIMRAAERIVKESSWLPSVHDVIERCDIGVDLRQLRLGRAPVRQQFRVARGRAHLQARTDAAHQRMVGIHI